ncbi:hypothetical protein C1645_856544 [Glomus cerebriforme]|uniref:Uncharacterized protein n=1 Tax=Glomus cerebriforme TaxID=658196 RepID=A0A397SKR6_9GLOM|nr:hypothetical protein C1645_856544 [Glomus cerebriforme]
MLQGWIREKEHSRISKENLPEINNPYKTHTKGAPRKRMKNALEGNRNPKSSGTASTHRSKYIYNHCDDRPGDDHLDNDHPDNNHPDEEHNDESSLRNTKVTRGVRDVVHARGLRRSKRVIDYSCEIYAKEDEDEEEKEEKEVLNSSHQSSSTTPQPSSTQQSSSQQSAISTIIIDPEIITSQAYMLIMSSTPIERQ